MSYIKADEILPQELIRQIQEYVDGVYIYIPRKPGSRYRFGGTEPEVPSVRKKHPQDSAKEISNGAVK